MEETIKGKHEMEETNTIKGKEVIAYKGMNSDMTCKGFQYEIGKTYKTDKAELCNCGFHACLNPIDVLEYYYQSIKSRYFKVKLSGEVAKCDISDTNVAATEITILEEITIDEIIKTTEWWKHENVLDFLYFSDGFARVKRGDKQYSFIDKDGKFLSDEWFKWVDNFYDRLARVQRSENLCNFINKDGKFLSKKWFKWVFDFHDGFAKVQRGDKLWNFIDKKVNYLSDEWFNYLGDFRGGFARVQRSDNLCNFINANGKILSEQWFNWADDFYDGVTRVLRGYGKFIKIDKTGKFIKNCSRIWEKLLKICNRIWKRFI